MKDYYTIPEFAREVSYHRDTIRKWIKNGSLKAWRVGQWDHFRIPASELERVKKKMLLN